MISLNQIFNHHPQVVTTELDSTEAVLLHLQKNRYFTLNETGWCIWKFLDGKLNLKQVAQRLYEDYDVDLTKAEQSVLNLIDELHSEKLVEIKK